MAFQSVARDAIQSAGAGVSWQLRPDNGDGTAGLRHGFVFDPAGSSGPRSGGTFAGGHRMAPEHPPASADQTAPGPAVAIAADGGAGHRGLPASRALPPLPARYLFAIVHRGAKHWMSIMCAARCAGPLREAAPELPAFISCGTLLPRHCTKRGWGLKRWRISSAISAWIPPPAMHG
jgi:hypothetical protein